MKILKVLLLTLVLVANWAYAAEKNSSEIVVEPYQAVVQVKGIVCSFCAYGTEKNLAKLKFLDASKFGNGVLMDIHTHRITLAVAPGERLDLKRVYRAIKKGGYDPVIVYVRLRGTLDKTNNRYLLTDADSGQVFELTGSGFEQAPEKDVVGVQAHLDATQIPSLKEGQPVKVVVTRLEVSM